MHKLNKGERKVEEILNIITLVNYVQVHRLSEGAIVGIIVGCIAGLIISIVLAVITARIAERKGYHYWGFFWLHILIGILALILVVLIEDRAEKYRREELRHMELIRCIKEGNMTKKKPEPVSDELFWICKNCGGKNSAQYDTCGRCGNKRSV